MKEEFYWCDCNWPEVKQWGGLFEALGYTEPSNDVDFNVLPNDGDEITFEVNVIGIEPTDVSLTAEAGNKLRVKTELDESVQVSFAKEINCTFQVPDTHKAGSAEAIVSNGVLTVSVGKRKSAKSKEIKIEY